VPEGGEAALRFCCARAAGQSVPRPKYPVLKRRSPWCRVAIDAFVAARCEPHLTFSPRPASRHIIPHYAGRCHPDILFLFFLFLDTRSLCNCCNRCVLFEETMDSASLRTLAGAGPRKVILPMSCLFAQTQSRCHHSFHTTSHPRCACRCCIGHMVWSGLTTYTQR
jgi:hypothetical protein